jgi:hypothetical protein
MSNVNASRKKAKKATNSASRRSAETRAPDRERQVSPQAPAPLALRCDGAILLSVHDLDERSLQGRETWTGVLLKPKELKTAKHRFGNSAVEIASVIGASLSQQIGERP